MWYLLQFLLQQLNKKNIYIYNKNALYNFNTKKYMECETNKNIYHKVVIILQQLLKLK